MMLSATGTVSGLCDAEFVIHLAFEFSGELGKCENTRQCLGLIGLEEYTFKFNYSFDTDCTAYLADYEGCV